MGAAGWLVAALAVSLNGVVVGAAYGARSVLMPAGSLILAGSCSSLLALAGGFLGGAGLLAAGGWAQVLGALMLAALGLSQLLRAGRGGAHPRSGSAAVEAGDDGGAKPLLLRIRLLNVVVKVVLEPEAGDVDRSGRLESGEAALVGLSLGLDAAAAGLAAALGEEARAVAVFGFPSPWESFRPWPWWSGFGSGRAASPPRWPVAWPTFLLWPS